LKQLNDISRLRKEYADRALRFSGSDVYSLSNPANLFIVQGRQRAVLKALKKFRYSDLSDKQILEMGCGSGGVLAEFLFLGASSGNLFGIDLILERLQQAHNKFPDTHLANANGQHLPFPPETFDLVLQYTAISSILDPDLRRAICADLIRVTRPGGLILSYDFWTNPTNPQTRGFHPKEIRQLFPDCVVGFQKITLAPPIVRRIVPISWGLAQLLESLRFLNTHYLSVIQPHVHHP